VNQANKAPVAQSVIFNPKYNVPHEETEFSKAHNYERVNILRQLLTKSIRSDLFKIKLPEKIEEINSFIQSYKSVNPEVSRIHDSKHFTVIPYKGLKALYFGEAVNKEKRHGLGVYLCQNLIF
jgi:hypothetical protein